MANVARNLMFTLAHLPIPQSSNTAKTRVGPLDIVTDREIDEACYTNAANGTFRFRAGEMTPSAETRTSRDRNSIA